VRIGRLTAPGDVAAEKRPHQLAALEQQLLEGVVEMPLRDDERPVLLGGCAEI